MPVSQLREKVSAGRVFGTELGGREADLRGVAAEVSAKGYEFFAVWIGGCARAAWNPADHPNVVSIDQVPPISIVDIQLKHSEWRHYVVGRLSPWIDPDSSDPRIATLSVQALKEEMAFVRYLDLTAVVFRLRRPKSEKAAKVFHSLYWSKQGNSMMLWTLLPLSLDQGDAWTWWYDFRTAIGNHHKVTLCPSLPLDLPEMSPEEEKLWMGRWGGEPLAGVWLSSELFNADHRLSPAHGRILGSLYRQGVQVLVEVGGEGGGGGGDGSGGVEGVGRAGAAGGAAELSGHLWASVNEEWQARPSPDSITRFAEGYEDHLQTPLQPLSEHLESSTYEVFERDPVKYKVYGAAIRDALLEKLEAAALSKAPLVIMVLGAGRGPLVVKCRDAVAALGKPPQVRIVAVEKNPFAALTLRHRNAEEWGGEVEVVQMDMRSYCPKVKATIVVSELLGSFGDNELSPECLDGAANLLAPDAISIPRSYTSFLAPLHSPRLHVTVRDDMGKNAESISGKGVCNASRPLTAASALHPSKVSQIFDIPYVVRLHNHFLIAPPQPLFSFHHPRQEGVGVGGGAANERSGELRWKAPIDSELMGLAGFFETELYGPHRLSIHPETHSEGMFSWFPILFPLPHPVFVPKGEEIKARMERRVSADRVWYEWSLVEPSLTRLQNLNGAASGMIKTI